MEARHMHSRAEGEWQQALELEKRLKATYRKKSFYDSEARTLRSQLRSLYESLLFVDAQFAAANDVEVLLWKSVFYRPIEEFRARIKQADKAGEAGAAQLPKVAGAFLRFLDDASLFYRRLVMQLQAAYGDVGVKLDVPAAAAAGGRQGGASSAGGATPNGAMQYSTGSSVHRNISASIHRCLIYLGDLARYTAQAQPKAETAAAAAIAGPGKRPAVEREWQRARDYYKHAAKVLPRSGNPHNQLAVMAVMEGNALKAVYHYARSLCVGIPFLTARENLLLLFEQNRAAYAELVTRKQQQQQQQLSILQLHSELAVCYVRLSGLLFDKINQHEYQAVCMSSAAALGAFLSHPAIMDFLQRQGRSDWQSRADTTPLHLLVLSIFAVQHSTASSNERRTSASEAGGVAAAGGIAGTFGDAAQRSTQRSRALSMVFRTAGLLCQAASAALISASASPAPNAGGNGAGAKPGVACLLLAAHILLQWLAAHPEFAVLHVAQATEEEAKTRATLWAAAAQLIASVAAAYPCQALATSGAAANSAAAVGGGVQPGRAAGAVIGSGSAGAECEGGALPEEMELLGFEPLRSKHYWHVTDVGKRAVDEPATRASRMLAAARMVSTSLSADQQQQRRSAAASAPGNNAVQPQTLKRLSAAVQQFVVAVAAAGNRQGTPAQTVPAEDSVVQLQQHQHGQMGRVTSAAVADTSTIMNDATAMDADNVQQQEQPVATLSTAAVSPNQQQQQQHLQQQQQQHEDDELEEEVIVFKPRTVRTSASTSAGSALPAVAACNDAGAAAAAVAVASAAPPPLPQQLLASRSHGCQPGVPSAAAAAGPAPPQHVSPDTAQPMIMSPAGSVKAVAVREGVISKVNANGTSGGGTPRSGIDGTGSPVQPGTARLALGETSAGTGPGVMSVTGGGTGSGTAAGMLFHGHAATALDLQQGQAASEMLLARLGGGSARNTSPPLVPSAANSGGLGLQGMSASGLPPAPGLSSLGAGLQAAPGFSRGGSGFAAQVNPNLSGGGFRSQPPSPAVFAAAAAGTGSFAAGAQQQQQAMLGAGSRGFLAGLNAGVPQALATAPGFTVQQLLPVSDETLNLNLGFGTAGQGLSQQGGGGLDGFEGFDPLGVGLSSALSPGNTGGGFTDSLLGFFGDSTAAGAPSAGPLLQTVSNSMSAAPISISQPQTLQTQKLQTGPQLGTSANIADQLEQTAKAAADRILSPEHDSIGLALLQQQQQRKQQQGVEGLMPGARVAAGGLVPATGLVGSGNLAPMLQQQQQQGLLHRHLSADPTSPSAVQAIGCGRGPQQVQQQLLLGRISAPSVLMQNADIALNSSAAAAAFGGHDGSAGYGMFSGPNVFEGAVQSSGLQLQNQQRKISNSSVPGSHASHQGIAAVAASVAADPGVPGLHVGFTAAAATDRLAGIDSPMSPDGGLTLLDYLAKQQAQQQQFGAGMSCGVLGQPTGGCGVQQDMRLGFDSGMVGSLANGGGSGTAFFDGGRPSVLLPPVDIVQSQNPFAS